MMLVAQLLGGVNVAPTTATFPLKISNGTSSRCQCKWCRKYVGWLTGINAIDEKVWDAGGWQSIDQSNAAEG